MQTTRVEQEIFRHLSGAFIHYDDCDRQLMRQFGLTITQFWALVHLQGEEGRSLSELAALLFCDKSNMTSVVDKLEKSGLAERKRGKAGDRRYIRVVLTKEGHELRKRAVAAHEYLLQMRLQTLQPMELSQLVNALQLLYQVLQTQFENGEVANFIALALDHNQTLP